MKKFLSMMLIFTLCIYVVGCTGGEMDAGELAAKRVIEQQDGFSDVESVDFLEKANNGYSDYYYYDVTVGEKSYIVALKGSGSMAEFSSKMRYTSFMEKKQVLNDMIEYQKSDLGTLGDRIG